MVQQAKVHYCVHRLTKLRFQSFHYAIREIISQSKLKRKNNVNLQCRRRRRRRWYTISLFHCGGGGHNRKKYNL